MKSEDHHYYLIPLRGLLTVLYIDTPSWQDSSGVIGDAFKLWEVFDRTENNGLVGVFLTIFVYLFLSFLSRLEEDNRSSLSSREN